MRKFILLIPLILTCFTFIYALNGSNNVWDNSLFELNIFVEQRVGDNNYQKINFSCSEQIYPDHIVIIYSAPELDVIVTISPEAKYLAPAYYFNIRALFKQETYLHEIYLSMDNLDHPVLNYLKGVEAIEKGDSSRNKTITPYMDKVVEYTSGEQHFWIVASEYDGCDGIEGLMANKILLYDYHCHFYRAYDAVNQGPYLLRDSMYKTTGSSHQWSFLLFLEKPVLLDINRWLGNRKAALSISSDSNGESLERLKAVFEGSTNPASPKYYKKGFFARNIPVTYSVYGCNKPPLGNMWSLIQSKGSCIGYHTYSSDTDAPEINAQSLINDLASFNIRTWTDHISPYNPENISYHGLNMDSPYYLGDIINQTNIDYIWPADYPITNPFNAFDNPWRLPHIIYEAKALTRPVYFFGRTEEKVWQYLDCYLPISMKYIMTPSNLDALIAENGLHIAYTHLCFSQNNSTISFWQQTPTGDYEIRDDVDEMLQMLDFYRRERGLWIAPLEDIFDRMLAIEQVKITSIEPLDDDFYRVTLHNYSDFDIAQLCINYKERDYMIPLLAAGESYQLYLANYSPDEPIPPAQFNIRYQNGNLTIKNKNGLNIDPLRLEIFNIRGQRVFSQHLINNGPEINLPFNKHSSGIYLMRLSPDNGTKPIVLRFSFLK